MEQIIDELFEQMIRHEMTEKQFWGWVADWKDSEALVDEAVDWDADLKYDDIREFLNYTGGGSPEWREKAVRLLKKSEVI